MPKHRYNFRLGILCNNKVSRKEVEGYVRDALQMHQYSLRPPHKDPDQADGWDEGDAMFGNVFHVSMRGMIKP